MKNATLKGFRTCTKCRQTLPATTDHFQMHRPPKTLKSRCKDCVGEYHKEWASKNLTPARQSEYHRRARENRPRFIDIDKADQFPDLTVDIVCGHCGKVFSVLAREVWRQYCSKLCSSKANYKGGFQPGGQDHWNWQGGGVSQNDELRKTAGYKRWRRTVITRDNLKCVNCNSDHGRVHAHHVMSFSEFPQFKYELWNGETLCRRCHEYIHTAEYN